MRSGCDLGATWMRPGCDLDATWMRPGCDLDAIWMRPGCDLDATWMRPGCDLGATWMRPGCDLDATWILLASRSQTLLPRARWDDDGGQARRWSHVRNSRLGHTVRIGLSKPAPDMPILCFHCHTHLVETFRHIYLYTFGFEGNRTMVK
jgi:hypothetical protein